jgi:hypothetical protein
MAEKRSNNGTTSTSESHSGFQGEGGFGRPEGRQDPGRAGPAVRCPPQPDHGLEDTARRGRGWSVWRRQSRGTGESRCDPDAGQDRRVGAHWPTSYRLSRKCSKWKLEKSTSNTHGKNSRGSAQPDCACGMHPAATPSAWDDTEKPNPAAPAVRDDATYIPTSPNAVPVLDHFWKVQVDHSSLAPKLLCRLRVRRRFGVNLSVTVRGEKLENWCGSTALRQLSLPGFLQTLPFSSRRAPLPVC